MQHTIARELLNSIYHDVSAVVSLASDGAILGVSMFDTRFAGACMHVHGGAAQVWLMTNHPQGRKTLYRADEENIEKLRAQAPRAPLRIFITGEDIGVMEVPL